MWCVGGDPALCDHRRDQCQAPPNSNTWPPKISIEGHGIKRGLTAVEAAILMEEPLDRS